MDAQSVKTVEEPARISGYDGHKRVKGRKWHLLVDTLGLPVSICVTPASTHKFDGDWSDFRENAAPLTASEARPIRFRLV